MKCRSVPALFLVAFCLGALPAGLWAYGGGTGTPEDPYLIETAEHLHAIGAEPNDWDKHFRLTEDIDLSAYTGSQFNLIGLHREDLEIPFSGVFDGQGHTIANFTYEVAGHEDPADGWVRYIGLFRCLDGASAEIRDLTLVDPNLYPSPACIQRVGTVGALAGIVRAGLITGCHVEGGCVRAEGYAGGLVGRVRRHTVDDLPMVSHCSTDCEVLRAPERSFVDVEGADYRLHWYHGGMLGANDGVVSDCNVTGPVSGGRAAGGLVGQNKGDIMHCQATGPVSGESGVGGLAGESHSGTISSSWASGDVTGPSEVALEEIPLGVGTLGGLVGSCQSATTSDCYATGSVTGDARVGGLVGDCHGSTIERCYATGTLLATDQQAGGLVGATGNGTVISECYASASVSVPWAGGGLVGLNAGTIRASWADGTVLGTSGVGGLVGEHWKHSVLVGAYSVDFNGVMTDCYAMTDVICDDARGGGLVGFNKGGTVLRCFATGQVIGFEDMGGLVGIEHADYPSEVAQSFWDMETTGLSFSASGLGRSTHQMQDGTTYIEGGWDFADETANGTEEIWWILEGQDYPRLWWELTEEEPSQ